MKITEIMNDALMRFSYAELPFHIFIQIIWQAEYTNILSLFMCIHCFICAIRNGINSLTM